MQKRYLFIDTNIYVYCALLTGDEKHDSELINKLEQILSEHANTYLLLPEVVKLEYERISKETLKYKSKQMKELISELGKQNNYSYLSTAERKSLSNSLLELIKKRDKNVEYVNEKLKKIFESKKTLLLEITPEIIANAYKRALAGKKPFSLKKTQSNMEDILHNPINADCVIFETILGFLKKEKSKKPDEIFICTKNLKDFSDMKNGLAEDIKKDLPIDGTFYEELPYMLEKKFKKKISPETKEKYMEVSTASSGIANLITISPDSYIPQNNNSIHLKAGDNFRLLQTISGMEPFAILHKQENVSTSPLISSSQEQGLLRNVCSLCGNYYPFSPIFADTGRCEKCRGISLNL